MALNKDGSVENLKYSIERHLKYHLGSTLTFDWEGARFETSGATEWVQERVMGMGAGTYHRGVGGGLDGQTVPVLLSCNVFVNPNKTTKTNRPYEIRDLLFNKLRTGTTIGFYAFASGSTSTTTQILKVRDVVTDSPVPNDDLLQWNLTVEIDWLEKW